MQVVLPNALIETMSESPSDMNLLTGLTDTLDGFTHCSHYSIV